MSRLLLGLLLFGLAACTEPEAPPLAPDAAADSVFTHLARLDLSAVTEAYARLHSAPFIADIRLDVLDADGAVMAFASRTVRISPREQTILAADSSGVFPDEGAFADLLTVSNPLPRLLPDDPAFLSQRTREQYRYAARDTLLDGQLLRVLEAVLRSDAEGTQAVWSARYLLAPGTERMHAVDIQRASTSVLFDEASRVSITLQRDGRLPARAVTETTVDVPGHGPRRLRLTETFAPLGGP